MNARIEIFMTTPRLMLPFATAICVQPHLTAEESICLAASKGCSHTYIDLNFVTDHVPAWNYTRMGGCRELAHRLGVSMVVHGNLHNALACEEDKWRKKAIEYTVTEIQLAAELSAPLILHASSYFPDRKEPVNRSAARSNFIRSLQEIGAIAVNMGVSIWIENLPKLPNHPRESVFCGKDDYETVFTAVKGLSMIYDVGHANVNNPHPETILSSTVCPIATICVSDNDGKSDTHKSLGHGQIDWKAFLNKIAETDWHGMVVFETMGSAPDEEVLFLSQYLSNRASS
jgi:sugar phosphate isomerase/epimerase